MRRILLIVAVLGFVLLFPAALFMAALVIRNLPLNETATGAQRIVMWYAGRSKMPNAARQRLALIWQQPIALSVMGMTFTAAGILTVVVLHMLAN